jgi:acyl carrier protein
MDGKEERVNEELTIAVRKFISHNFLFREDMGAMADDASFLEAGIMDSTGVMELIAYLEHDFNVEVADEEMVPENFDSVARIVAYLRRKLAAARAAGADCSPGGAPSLAPSYAG